MFVAWAFFACHRTRGWSTTFVTFPGGVTVDRTSRLPLDEPTERVGVVRETVSSEGARVPMEGFTAHQATKFTGCSPRQLRYWDQIGLVTPSVQQTGGRPGVPRLYSFRDLVALKVVRSLLDSGMSLQRVRRAWDYLNRRAALDKHLSEVKLITDGVSIFKIARRNGEIIDALRDGQLAFFVAIDEIATGVEVKVGQFKDDRERFVRALREAAAHAQTGR
jgi:DNA-binding transcriptional MerR regulator